MKISDVPCLENIYDEFDYVLEYSIELLIKEDIVSLYESMYNLIDEFVNNHPMYIKKSSFDNDLENYVIENIEILFQYSEININNEDLSEILIDIYNTARKEYFTYFIPPRSYSKSFIRKSPDVNMMKNKITILRNKPQPDQRTSEWYRFRYNLLTASSIWKAFSTQNMKNQLIYEKCTPLNISKYNSINIESPLHHGQKYEDLSIMYYELTYDTKVEDFGCIQHDNYKYIGASPDGINVKENNQRYGRMLEIKNVVNREITGIPKEEYWIQMQIQMETCDLNECDFLETQFNEYESEEEFINDNSNKLKGLIIYFMENGKPFYKYMPLEIKNYKDMITWENSVIEENSDLTWIKTIYWRLEKVSCVLVLRNKIWFSQALPYIKELWNNVETERINGYEHRAPKKSQRKRASSIVNIETEEKGCLIDNSLFTYDLNSNNIMKNIENIVIEKNCGELFTDLSFNTNNINN